MGRNKSKQRERERERKREKNEKYIAIAMQNTRKYNLLYFEFHILWRFIGFPSPTPGPTPPSRFTQACENFKRQQQISHTVLWVPSLSEAFGLLLSISNLIYDIESISSVCVCVSTQYMYVCVCVWVFALRSASIFHIFLSFFYTLPFGLHFCLGMGVLNDMIH